METTGIDKCSIQQPRTLNIFYNDMKKLALIFFPEWLKIYGTDSIRYNQLWPYKKKIVRTNKQMIEAE
jgi:hypothetical protein